MDPNGRRPGRKFKGVIAKTNDKVTPLAARTCNRRGDFDCCTSGLGELYRQPSGLELGKLRTSASKQTLRRQAPIETNLAFGLRAEFTVAVHIVAQRFSHSRTAQSFTEFLCELDKERCAERQVRRHDDDRRRAMLVTQTHNRFG